LKIQTTTKQYQIPDMPGTGKEEEKPLIPGPVWCVEKLILAQHCFKPAPAAIGNVPETNHVTNDFVETPTLRTGKIYP
jgi:hypothetical protein